MFRRCLRRALQKSARAQTQRERAADERDGSGARKALHRFEHISSIGTPEKVCSALQLIRGSTHVWCAEVFVELLAGGAQRLGELAEVLDQPGEAP